MDSIGETEIAVIEDVEVTNSVSHDESDYIEQGSNIVFVEEDGIEDITISFTLVKSAHPDEEDIWEQRRELKGLIKNRPIDNSFQYDGMNGFLSIESIDLSESSNVQTIRRGEIEGKFLPWPKHYPEEEFIDDEFATSGIGEIYWTENGRSGDGYNELGFVAGGERNDEVEEIRFV